MRIFWAIFTVLVFFQKVLLPFYFFILTAFKAPEDTSDLVRAISRVMDDLSGNVVIDLLLLAVGAFGLIVSTGWGNWQRAIHRSFSKSRLERLANDAERVAEAIAGTIAHERELLSRDMEVAWNPGEQRRSISLFSQDQSYLSRHMISSHAIIERLKDADYWKPPKSFNEIGVAGATSFAAQDICKALYAASERIKADLKDGFLTVLTQPPDQPSTEAK